MLGQCSRAVKAQLTVWITINHSSTVTAVHLLLSFQMWVRMSASQLTEISVLRATELQADGLQSLWAKDLSSSQGSAILRQCCAFSGYAIHQTTPKPVRGCCEPPAGCSEPGCIQLPDLGHLATTILPARDVYAWSVSTMVLTALAVLAQTSVGDVLHQVQL